MVKPRRICVTCYKACEGIGEANFLLSQVYCHKCFPAALVGAWDDGKLKEKKVSEW